RYGKPGGARRPYPGLRLQAPAWPVGGLPFVVMAKGEPEHAARPVRLGERAGRDQFVDPGRKILLVIDVDRDAAIDLGDFFQLFDPPAESSMQVHAASFRLSQRKSRPQAAALLQQWKNRRSTDVAWVMEESGQQKSRPPFGAGRSFTHLILTSNR